MITQRTWLAKATVYRIAARQVALRPFYRGEAAGYQS